MTLYDISLGACHVPLTGLSSDGSIAIDDNNVPVVVATVPLTTGVIPLDAVTLIAEIYLSYDLTTDDGTHIEQRRGYPCAAYRGNPTPASISSASLIYGQPYVSYSDVPGMSDYREIVTTINGSGDLEVKFKGLSSGAKPFTIHNLSVSYRIFGSK